ncbi:MAG TPA: SBBP repeat-containing protein, partial [Leptospiraceae bacterium]|nr:SBBP repeat-containing protein [Leptospiraceae bacterium]
SYLSGGFALTTFTIQAVNAFGSTEFKIDLQILGTGENVWTVIHGVTGYATTAGYGSLFFNSNSNSLYSAGATLGALDGESNPSPGVASGFVTKYDLNGNRIWTKLSIATSGGFGQNGLSVDSAENIYIGGSVYGPTTFDGITTPNSYNAAISKFAPDGTRQWSSLRYQNSSESFGNAIYADASGSVFLLGQAKGGLDFSANTAGSDAANSVMKYNSAGTWQSTTLVGTSSASTGRHVGVYAGVTDSAGNLWTGGYSQAGDKCANPDLKRTATIFKYNSSVVYQACYSLVSGTGGTAGEVYIFGITRDSSDNLYVTGYTNRNLDGITKTSTAGDSYYDAFIAKFNSSGTKLWTRLLGVTGNTTTKAYAITKSVDNFYYIIGETNGNLGGQTLNGAIDLFVAKYDTNGNLQTNGAQPWVKLLGSSGSTTVGTGIAFDTNNTMYATGHSTGDIGGTTNPVKPNNAHLLVRFVQ